MAASRGVTYRILTCPGLARVTQSHVKQPLRTGIGHTRRLEVLGELRGEDLTNLHLLIGTRLGGPARLAAAVGRLRLEFPTDHSPVTHFSYFAGLDAYHAKYILISFET